MFTENESSKMMVGYDLEEQLKDIATNIRTKVYGVMNMNRTISEIETLKNYYILWYSEAYNIDAEDIAYYMRYGAVNR